MPKSKSNFSREVVFQVRLSPDETKMLEGLAEHKRMNRCEIVRNLIREASSGIVPQKAG